MTAQLDTMRPSITAGIDAHKDTHHIVVLDNNGVRLADKKFPATSDGYDKLLAWAIGFGPINRIGIESTGSYAAGLSRHLLERGVAIIEVNSPHPHTKARKGKDDVIDAEAAARKVLAGQATVTPKDTTGIVESIRMLSLAKASAVKSRALALVQLQGVLITAPAVLREQITATTGRGKASQCAKFRPDLTHIGEPTQAAKAALRSLAKRITVLEDEIRTITAQLDDLVAQTAPTLTSRLGIGTSHAAQFLISAGQNADRLGSEAAFARLCGVAPIPVSSGKTHRMRLHRGGDRQANRALHLIAVCRLRYDPKTIIYMERRRTEGLSKKDVLRCLKRFIAREVFHDLVTDLNHA